MKKLSYLALAALTFALYACNSKPAESQPAEEQEPVEVFVQEESVELEIPLGEAAEVLAEEPEPAEEPAEEPAAEPIAEEQPAEEPAEEETVFMVVEKMATPPCSGAELIELLTVDLNDIDPEANNCRAMVSVIIEKDGRLSNPTVRRSTGNEKLDAYAVEFLLKKLPRFKEPGIQSGHPVRTHFTLPVTFKK